jgi:hypothetical protein
MFQRVATVYILLPYWPLAPHPSPLNLSARESLSPESEKVRRITYEIIGKNMQNKPNFRKSQMNVSNYITTEYEEMDTWSSGENKPNQTQFTPAQPVAKPKQTQYEPNLSRPSRMRSRIKPNFKPHAPSLTGFRSKTLLIRHHVNDRNSSPSSLVYLPGLPSPVRDRLDNRVVFCGANVVI